MTEFGCFLSCEEFTPAELLDQARQAEGAGFTRLPVTTLVTCPTVRLHPAVTAQAAATCSVLTAGRFRLGVGTGEALNEHQSPLFYGLCVLLVAAFVAVHAAGLAVEWRLVIGDTMTAVTLLLLTLLKNAERRAEHAVQRKLDAIAGALLLQLDAGDARSTLEHSIGMEDDI